MKTKTNLALIILSACLLAGCSTTDTGNGGGVITTPSVGITVQAADTAIKAGYDGLNSVNKWQHDHRAALKKDGPLTTSLRATKSKLWKAIGNATRRRDAFAESDAGQVPLEVALAELTKVIIEANVFVEANR